MLIGTLPWLLALHGVSVDVNEDVRVEERSIAHWLLRG
jgi:hypothetical protein